MLNALRFLQFNRVCKMRLIRIFVYEPVVFKTYKICINNDLYK